MRMRGTYKSRKGLVLRTHIIDKMPGTTHQHVVLNTDGVGVIFRRLGVHHQVIRNAWVASGALL
jgi:hypothetical protein